MKKIIWVTTIIIIFSVFILPGMLALVIKYKPYNNQPSLERVKDIYGGYTISQNFVSQENNLTAVGITIKNPNLRNKKDFYLYLYEDDIEIRKVKFNGANVADGSYLKFFFDPIVNSKGKNYKIWLTDPTATEEDLLGVYYTLNKPEWIKQMMFGEEKVDGGISLVTYHKAGSKFGIVKEIYTNLFSRLLPFGFQKSS